MFRFFSHEFVDDFFWTRTFWGPRLSWCLCVLLHHCHLCLSSGDMHTNWILIYQIILEMFWFEPLKRWKGAQISIRKLFWSLKNWGVVLRRPQICRCPYVLNISNSSLSSVIILSGCVYKNPVHVITLKIFQFYRAAACCLELRVHSLGNLSSQCNNKFEQVQNLKIWSETTCWWYGKVRG